jgi:hypothetical protein
MLACNGHCATRAMLRIDRAQTVLALIPLHTVRLGCANGNKLLSNISVMIKELTTHLEQ